MLKTSKSTKSIIQFRKIGVRVSVDSRTGRNGRCKLGNEVDDVEIGEGKVGDNEIEKKSQKTSKSKKLSKSKKIIRSDFFTLGARLAFIKLRQASVKAPIFHHFNPKCYIRVETNESGYAIGKGLS